MVDLVSEYQNLREKIYGHLFTGLNDQQMQVVSCGNGPVLCLAGAGSGKTRAMIYRLLHLYLFGPYFKKEVVPPWELTKEDLYKLKSWLEKKTRDLSPEIIELIRVEGIELANILAITFTNKAAEEMKVRLSRLLGPLSRQVWVMTFHAFCLRILQREITYLGYQSNFAIYDSQDQLALLRSICRTLNLNEQNYPPRKIQYLISRYKCDLLTPKQARQNYPGFREKTYLEIYTLYQQSLKENNALDFDDLIMLTVHLFIKHPEVLAKYQERFHYLMIDEYQDTNHAQYKLAKLLAGKRQNICVVGDDDQSIYGFRAADVRNILDFERDYPQAKVIKLEQNYRSTQMILAAANQVIACNRGRKAKQLWTQKPKGEPLLCFMANDENDEAAFVIEKIKELKNQGVPYGACAVLMRLNAQSRIMEEWLIRAGIPYKLVGGVKFYERKEIKDLLAYLRVLVNPEDNLSLKRIINEPRRGIGKTTWEKITAYASTQNLSYYETLFRISQLNLTPKIARAVQNFAQLLQALRETMSQVRITELTQMVLKESGYQKQLEKENTKEAVERWENIQAFLTKTLEYDLSTDKGSLGDFLNQVALVTDLDDLAVNEEAVVVMTVHSAKGLEFPHVFLLGLEENIFPHYRSLDNPDELEEERRLCYVALTRAQERLYLLYTRERYLYGQKKWHQPSRFLKEIPPELCVAHKRAAFFETTPAYQVTTHAFNLGDKVVHQRWGTGVIVQVRGTGSDLILGISFPSYGKKMVLAKYAPLKKVK